MSFQITQSGFKGVEMALLRLRQSAPNMFIGAVQEIDKRHSQAYQRRTIPIDTGALQASLRNVGDKKRMIFATKSGITIGTTLHYAKYQRKRIRELSRIEKKEIFVTPIFEELQELLAGRRR